jgi:hypothetical protein
MLTGAAGHVGTGGAWSCVHDVFSLPLVPVRESSHHGTVTTRVTLLVGLIAATLAAGCKQEAQSTGPPAQPSPPPAQAPPSPAPIGNPFAHPPPWAPDPPAPLPSSVRIRTVPPSPPPAQSADPVVALERTLVASKDPSQAQRGRVILEARVFGHKATREEVGMLTSLCQAEPDKICAQALDQESLR